MKKTFLYLFCLALPLIAMAQYKTQAEPADIGKALRNPLTLPSAAAGLIGLDPSRLSVSHSYSMSVVSLGGHALSQGLYLNTISYQLSDPLLLSVQWGVAHQPFATTSQHSLFSNGPFISNARLLYKPSKNTIFEIQYQHIPNGYGYRGYRPLPFFPE